MSAPAGARTRGTPLSASPELSYYWGSRSGRTWMAASRWTTAAGHWYTLLTLAEIFHPFASFCYIRGNFQDLLCDSDAWVVITIPGIHDHGNNDLMYIDITHKHALNTHHTCILSSVTWPMMAACGNSHRSSHYWIIPVNNTPPGDISPSNTASQQRHHRLDQLVFASFVVSHAGLDRVQAEAGGPCPGLITAAITHTCVLHGNTTHGEEVHTKTRFSSDRQPNSKLCVNTYLHPHILHNLDRKMTLYSCWNRLLAPLPTLFLARLTAARALARVFGGPHLTLIDPVGENKHGSTCSKMENYHFKEVPRKRLAL